MLLLRERVKLSQARRAGEFMTGGLCALGIKKAPQFFAGLNILRTGQYYRSSLKSVLLIACVPT